MLIDGRYAVVNALGKGGFGVVYLVTDVRTGERLALKFLLADGAEAWTRFRREVALLEQLVEHQHVLKLRGYNLSHTPPYLVTEYCEGGSLANWRGQRVSWRAVVMALAHSLLGVEAIHDAGGFHRDLKPENLLVTAKAGRPGETLIKVGDWGLARAPSPVSPVTRSPAGTPGYMAPELFRGHPFVASADIYSLGVMGAELLTGVNIYDENAGGAQAAFDQLAGVPMPSALRSLLRAMTNQDPTERPTTREVAATLTSVQYEVIATEEGVEAEFGALVVGALLLGGIVFVALKALAEDEKPPGSAATSPTEKAG